MKILKGTGVALVTPFKRNGNIDFEGLKKLVEHVLKGKVDYLVIMGTTGESPVLSREEKYEVFEKILTFSSNRIPLVYGIGGNNTRQVIHELKSFPYLKHVEAILSVAPYYNKPNQEGFYQHYKTLSNNSSKPIILYNVPGRTGSNISWETQVKIARHCKKIVATKEASGNLEQITQILLHAPSSFLVISGDDNLTLPIMASGGHGVISVSANAYPSEVSEMVRLCLKGDFDKARKIHLRLFEITRQLFADGNPGGIKYLLSEMKIIQPHVRLPLMPPSESVRKQIHDNILSF